MILVIGVIEHDQSRRMFHAVHVYSNSSHLKMTAETAG